MSGPGVTKTWDSARRTCHIRNEYVREAMAEFLGTGILCLFAVGSGVQGTMGQDPLSSFGGIFGLMTAILIVGGVSGGHINPAVTLGLALGGQVSWFKVPLFWVSQLLGGYVGSILGALLYWARANGYPDGTPYCLVFSYQGGSTKIGTGFADQIVMTAVFMMAIYALIDRRNMGVPKHMVPFLLSLVVGAIGWTYGMNAGAPVNPARDLMPRLAALTMGCVSDAVMKNSEGDQWWVVGFFGPLIGASIGAFLYILVIGAHLEDDEQDMDPLKSMGPEYMPSRFMPQAQVAPKMADPPRFIPENRAGVANQGYDGNTYGRGRGGY